MPVAPSSSTVSWPGPTAAPKGIYNRPPFMPGTKQQGPQSADGPAATYRKALAALDQIASRSFGGKRFADLADEQKDELLKSIEDGKTKLEGVDGKSFFDADHQGHAEGFFADPIYGGNRDMVAWKMIGYPGARYNYLDWVDRHNERFPLPPVEHHGPRRMVSENESEAMARKLPKKDVVIIGLGWTGSIMANELTDEGLDVIAIERGPWRDAPTDFPPNYVQDELRYRIRHELFLRPSRIPSPSATRWIRPRCRSATGARSCRRTASAAAACTGTRKPGAFCRPISCCKTHLTERYGATFLPEDMTIQDWGVTYDDLEPHYDAFEYLCGTSGTAGNLRGQIQEGGNPFEGPRSRPYPTPAQKQPFSHTLFAKAARELGYKPFPQPSGNLSQAYTNPLGLQMGPCTYCGFCEWFGCGNYSKASPQTTILPLLIRKPNFSARDNSEVIAHQRR